MSFLDLPDKIYKKVEPNSNWDGVNIYEIFHNVDNEQCYRPILESTRGSHVGHNLPYLSWIMTSYGVYGYSNLHFNTLKNMLLFDFYYNHCKLIERIEDSVFDKWDDSRELVKTDIDFYNGYTDEKVPKDDRYFRKYARETRLENEIYDEPVPAYEKMQEYFERIFNYNNKKYGVDYVAKKHHHLDIYEGMPDGIYYD